MKSAPSYGREETIRIPGADPEAGGTRYRRNSTILIIRLRAIFDIAPFT
jgi:hypothetical protein